MKPDKPTGRRYLGDANYPADLRELISEAEGNGAPAPLIERLKNLPTDVELSDPSEVAVALERQDESYEEHARSRRDSFWSTAGRGSRGARLAEGAGPDALAGGGSRQLVAGGFS